MANTGIEGADAPEIILPSVIIDVADDSIDPVYEDLYYLGDEELQDLAVTGFATAAKYKVGEDVTDADNDIISRGHNAQTLFEDRKAERDRWQPVRR